MCAATACGQATSSLRGIVSDPSGAAVPGAQVSIVNSNTGLTRTSTTGPAGEYVFQQVLPGTYTLRVEAPGFDRYQRSNVVLKVELPETANVEMKVGQVREVVSVTSEEPELNTTDSSVGRNMGKAEIEELPLLGENMPLLLSFEPGVAYNGDKYLQDGYDTRAGAVNGEHSDQNNIRLDGVDDNDQFNGYSFVGVLPSTQFSVQEFRVTTSNYTADQARSAGAQIDMVTKSGTNQFHGSLYEFNRNGAGNANDFFLKNAQIANDEPNRPQKLVRNVFGGTIGGPIKKNRLFFFFNYEGHRQAFNTSQFLNIPSSTLRDGIIQYQCSDTTQCPGMSVAGASGKSYSIQPGWYGLGPKDLAAMDPLGIGPSQVAMDYFNTFPQPNGAASVDAPNYGGYRWAAPTSLKENWYIGRLDYTITANGNHSIFVRGAARDDNDVPINGAPFLPGQAPELRSVDLSKGIVASYTGAFTPRLVNNFRYGFTHQSIGNLGNSSQPWVYMRDLSQGITYSSKFVAPVHDIADTVSWVKGAHNLQMGTDILLVRRQDQNFNNSFSDVLTNADWVDTGGFAETGSPLDPNSTAFPAIASSSDHLYDFPLAAMMGIGSELDAIYNYRITNPTTGTAMGQGDPVSRNWSTDTYNIFVQDTWQMRRNLTLSYGLNYQLMTPITETSGQEITPSVNVGDWFNQRATAMLKGQPDNSIAPIQFAPSGSFYGRPGLYPTQNKNFAPRFGMSWSPNPDSGWLKKLTGDNATVIRAGAGMYYDNFGPALAMSYDSFGSFGLTSQQSNPANSITVAQAPRITGMNEIPFSDPNFPQALPATYPTMPPSGAANGELIAHGIDQSLKTPYSYALNLSIQRQLPGRTVLDVGYVGHLGHHILGYDDVAGPLDIVDPKTGIDYYAAATRFSQLARAGTPNSAITPALIGPTAAYWTDMFTGGGTPAAMLQGIYSKFNANLYNETSALYDFDVLGKLGITPVGGLNSFYNGQYSSWWDWRSIGMSNYNALQVSLHRDMSHGLLFGFNYTYSKSLDISSEAERGGHALFDSIINPWSPQQMYAPSDFDLRHQINGYWVAELPFGHGRAFGSGMNRALDAVLGGWQLGGTARWTSGYPTSILMGYIWPTNWDEMGWANRTSAPLQSGTTIINGIPWAFQNPTNAALAPEDGGPYDYAYPGQSGERNNFRGDGYFSVDANLSKTFKVTESKAFQLRWSVYNVTNSARFDVYNYMQNEWDAGNFGEYTNTLTQPRVMEFTGIFTF
ncbi:MAG TPA: carboxypeptidase-like regulatory domain-containing protein [Terriglobales bacterium]|nr:carboxypeptidase-like regulatory domain-containing protein [Terriglobales bacterium]